MQSILLLHKYITLLSRSVFLHVFAQDFGAYWTDTVLALHRFMTTVSFTQKTGIT
jgi:hypothetical protein